ncbi:MAG: hypothetical protein WA713_17600, partial [Candidatus Acidiferrales bacterium]
MRPRKFFYAFAAYIATIGLAVVISAETTHGRRIHASLADLCVTEGTISDLPAHGLSVTLPNVHATMNRETAQDIEARFVY